MSDTQPPRDIDHELSMMKRQRDSMIRRVSDVTKDVKRITSAPAPRILVVDDQPVVLGALAQSFRDLSGLEVVECHDAMRAKHLLATEDYAGVVLDLNLNHPEINGITLAEEVPRNRVLVLVSADPGAAEAAESLRAIRLGKPFRVHARPTAVPTGEPEAGDVWTDGADPRSSSVEEAAQEIMALLRKMAS